jgi:hypothetical protein
LGKEQEKKKFNGSMVKFNGSMVKKNRFFDYIFFNFMKYEQGKKIDELLLGLPAYSSCRLRVGLPSTILL